jgi:hypothetical protein
MKLNQQYTPPTPTPQQIASNAIRAMFFSRQYDGVVPVKDIEFVKTSKDWHKIYGKKAVQDSIKSLISEQYINLDEKEENWLWGLPGWHDELFPRHS